MREMAYLGIAERLKESGKTNVANIQDLLEPYLFPYFFQHLNVTIISPSGAWGEQTHEFWAKATYPCGPVYTLKCQIDGSGPNNQGGWKSFRNLINGGLGFLEMVKNGYKSTERTKNSLS